MRNQYFVATVQARILQAPPGVDAELAVRVTARYLPGIVDVEWLSADEAAAFFWHVVGRGASVALRRRPGHVHVVSSCDHLRRWMWHWHSGTSRARGGGCLAPGSMSNNGAVRMRTRVLVNRCQERVRRSRLCESMGWGVNGIWQAKMMFGSCDVIWS